MENNALFAHGGGRSRVLIVGGGFAGFTCAHELEKRLGAGGAGAFLVKPDEPADGTRREIGWDRLVLAPGAVTRTFPIPGLEEKARGFKTLAEALYLRDHILKQLDCADASDDEVERRARLTFVVVGAGYSGTEIAAQAQLFARKAVGNYPSLRPEEMRWLLVDIAPR